MALADYTSAIDLDSKNAESYLNRANICIKTGYPGLAAADFDKSCQLGNAVGCSALNALASRGMLK